MTGGKPLARNVVGYMGQLTIADIAFVFVRPVIVLVAVCHCKNKKTKKQKAIATV